MKNYIVLGVAVFFASLAGMISGFDTGVVSGALLYVVKSFEVNSQASGLIVGAVSVGAIFGALINGLLIDRLGRKKILILSGLIFLFGSIFSSLAQNVVHLIVSRAFLGLGVGVVSFAAPLYLSEIADKKNRGKLVSLYQAFLTFGILFSYLSNYFCSQFETPWRIMFFIGVVPAIILVLGMFFQMDTPRWYILNKQNNKAKEVLEKYKYQDIDLEIEEINKTLSCEKIKVKFEKKIIMPFIIGVGIMFVQIATGINAIIYYAPTIFKSIGFTSNEHALFVTIFIGLINFLMTFVATVFVDKIGRKPLLYIGLIGMLCSLLALSSVFVLHYDFMKYIALISCCVYIVSFSMSLGPIALLLISEVFPLKYRGWAMSVSIIFNFVFNFIVTSMFPILLDKIGGCYTFLIFASICVLSIFFIYFFVPETKGISLEEIEKKWS